jgi:hypothetical protein
MSNKDDGASKRKKTVTVAFRTDPATRHLIEAVALRKGVLMADYLREITLEAVTEDLAQVGQ